MSNHFKFPQVYKIRCCTLLLASDKKAFFLVIILGKMSPSRGEFSQNKRL